MILPNWAELHAALTHFPVALIITASAFDIGAVILRRPMLRAAGYWVLGAAVCSALPTLAVGFLAANVFFGDGRPPEILSTHRFMAFTSTGLALAAFIWRAAARDRLEGPPRAGATLLGILAAGSVGFTGFLGGRMLFTTAAASSDPPPAARAAEPVPDARLAAQGEAVFRGQNCLSCHRLGAEGAGRAPDLARVGARRPDPDWHLRHLRDPAGTVPGSMMPSYAHLSEEKLRALAAFLASRK